MLDVIVFPPSFAELHVGKVIAMGGNTFVAVCAIMCAWSAACLARERGYDEYAVELMKATAYVWIGVFLRIGYWSPGMLFAPRGQTYHPWFVEHNFLPALFGMWLIGYGSLKLMRTVGLFSKTWQYARLAFAAGAALVIVFIRTMVP